MRRIAIVSQRYGNEVNGGAETYTKEVAQKLSGLYEVEVLTTCALDYLSWKNYYRPGIHNVDGILVRRFPVKRKRNTAQFNKLYQDLIYEGNSDNNEKERAWVRAQGPLCDACIEYMEMHTNEYDAFIFITYLYYLTAMGIEKVREKALLVPTAHDEPPIHFPFYQSVFHAPQAIAFLTEEERYFVHGLFHNEKIPYEIVGMGMEMPKWPVSPRRFTEKHGDTPYILYAGRIDASKGCEELFSFFLRYKQERPSPLRLLLMGKAHMDISTHPDIQYLGFVDEQEKYDGIAGAKYLMLPSQFESLSISVLEGMMLGIPCIVNGRCAVLKGHCIRSNGGLYYDRYDEFSGILDYMERHEDIYSTMQKNAADYIRQNYVWDVVLRKYNELLTRIFDGDTEVQ